MDERVFARYMSDLAYFLTLFENNPLDKYHLPVALAYLKLAKYDECASVCLEGLKRFPSHCPTKTLLAEAYINIGEVAKARELLHDVVAEDDGNFKALKLLGIVMQAEELSDRAVRYFRLAYFKAPEDHSLIKMITDLGAKIDLDEILNEQSKQVGKRVEEVDEDTKTYNEINQSIKNAEIMMQELFDTDLDSNNSDNQEIDEALLDNLIEQTVNKSDKNTQQAGNDDFIISGSKDEYSEIHTNDENTLIVADTIQNTTNEQEEDSLASELKELIVVEAKEDEKRSEELTDELVRELSSIGFVDVDKTDYTIPTDVKGVGIDSKTGDVVVDLYNVVSDDVDPIDNIDIKPQQKDNEPYDIADIDNNEDIDIDTDNLSSEVDKLVNEANDEIISQLDIEIDTNKKNDEGIIEVVSEDFFEKSLATYDVNSLHEEEQISEETSKEEKCILDKNNASQSGEVISENIILNMDDTHINNDFVDDNKLSAFDVTQEDKIVESSKLNDIEKYYDNMIIDETFFNVNESEAKNKNYDDAESASFYQSDIFDEILEKSNLTVNDMLSSASSKLDDDKKRRTINKLEKKLAIIRKQKRKKA